MLCSTAKRQLKCHVWKICSTHFLYVKRVAVAETSLLRSYVAALMTRLVPKDPSPVFSLLICT